ncbi:MAG: transposase family protein [Candidatus Babeliaceae bacterium]|nr:transposase family protein [Candidatus Babeliaceae bacterium]
MALEYLREYRTYGYIAASYRVAESSAYKNIR